MTISTMRRLCLVLAVILVVVVSQPSTFVNGRVLLVHSTSATTNEIAGSKTSPTLDFSSDMKSHIVEREQVYTLASGPSRKGRGHR